MSDFFLNKELAIGRKQRVNKRKKERMKGICFYFTHSPFKHLIYRKLLNYFHSSSLVFPTFEVKKISLG